MELKVKTEAFPLRCEICHQSDHFDPLTNSCFRCAKVDVALLSSPNNLSPDTNTSGRPVVVEYLVLQAKINRDMEPNINAPNSRRSLARSFWSAEFNLDIVSNGTIVVAGIVALTILTMGMMGFYQSPFQQSETLLLSSQIITTLTIGAVCLLVGVIVGFIVGILSGFILGTIDWFWQMARNYIYAEY